MAPEGISYREGGPSDLETTFALSVQAVHASAEQAGIVAPGTAPDDAEVARRWERRRPLAEFIAAQPGCYWIAEDSAGEPVGYVRMVRFGEMEELTEVMVVDAHKGSGIGRELMELCWPGDPTPDLGRVGVATGAASDLSLYMNYGVMPIAGHWHMRVATADYRAARSHEIDATEPDVHVLTPERAVAEWKRLEPPAVGHRRPALHEYFGRDRTCLATLDADANATAVCWVSAVGEIGPAVAVSSEDLVPVLLQALDRVAKVQEPEYLGVYATSISWWLLRRLRGLGFKVWWPSWVMCSVPLPGLDRYVASRPPLLL